MFLRFAIVVLLGAAAVACAGAESAESAAVQPPAANATPPSGVASSAAPPAAPPQRKVADPAVVAARLEELRQQMEAAPGDTAAQRAYARALFGARQREAALPLFEALAEQDAGIESWLDLALVYGAMSRLDEAAALYERILAQQPDHAVALHNQANLMARIGDYDAAIAGYQRALTVRPGYLQAQAHLGDAYERSERFKEAYLAYAEVLKLDPKTPTDLQEFDNALFKMASLDIRMGAYQRAGQMLETLLNENPNHASAHYAYARLLIQFGRTEEAQPHLEAHMRLQAEADRGGVAAMGE